MELLKCSDKHVSQLELEWQNRNSSTWQVEQVERLAWYISYSHHVMIHGKCSSKKSKKGDESMRFIHFLGVHLPNISSGTHQPWGNWSVCTSSRCYGFSPLKLSRKSQFLDPSKEVSGSSATAIVVDRPYPWHVFFSSCISQAVTGHLHTTGRQNGAQYGQWQNVITDKSPSDPSPQACQRYLESWWIEKLMVKKLGLFMNSRLLHWICWGWV